MITISQILIQFHQELIFLIDIKFLIGKLMIHDIITNPLLEILIQLIILTNLICILNIVLELLLILTNSCEGMTNFTDNITC